MEYDVMAESSAAEAVPQQQSAPEMESWTDAQRTDWLKTGEPPKAEDSAPSKQETSAGDNKSESGPASEAGETQREPKRGTAEARIKELLAENRKLKESQKPAQTQQQAEVPQTQKPTQQTPPAAEGRPVRPKYESFDTVGEYEAAEDKYIEELAAWKADQRDAEKTAAAKQAEAQKAGQQRAEGWKAKQDAFRKQTADFDEVVAAADNEPCSDAIRDFCLESEIGPAVQYALAKDVELLRKLSDMSDVAAVRELTKLEMGLAGGMPSQTPAPKKTTTAASKPPTELSGRSNAPEDEAKAALEAGDFDRYRRVMNARDLKK
jgi:hypothetical protein